MTRKHPDMGQERRRGLKGGISREKSAGHLQ